MFLKPNMPAFTTYLQRITGLVNWQADTGKKLPMPASKGPEAEDQGASVNLETGEVVYPSEIFEVVPPLEPLVSTGIVLCYYKGKWSAACDFKPRRFPAGIQGQLETSCQDIYSVIEIVKRRAEAMGIQWCDEPRLYAWNQLDQPLPDHWYEILQPEAERIGWELMEA